MFYDGLADKVRTGEWVKFINAETDRLNLFLLQTNIDKQTAIENITDDVLSGYYYERSKVNTRSRDCEHREIMIAYNQAVCDVIIYIRSRIMVSYRAEFIDKWKRKANYFPFEEFMRMNCMKDTPGTQGPHAKRRDRTFSDFLTVDDENKEALIQRIGKIIHNAKAKKIAIIIRVLIDKRATNYTTGECAALCRALEVQYHISINSKSVSRYMQGGALDYRIMPTDIETIAQNIAL